MSILDESAYLLDQNDRYDAVSMKSWASSTVKMAETAKIYRWMPVSTSE